MESTPRVNRSCIIPCLIDLYFSINASVALVALIALLSYLERSEFLVHEREKLRRREADHLTQILRLENEMKLLLAMREVSRIVNDDVRFEQIWKKVLRIVRSLVHYEEVMLFLPEEGADGPLVPRVHHRNGRTLFGDEIDLSRIDPIEQPQQRIRLQAWAAFHANRIAHPAQEFDMR